MQPKDRDCSVPKTEAVIVGHTHLVVSVIASQVQSLVAARVVRLPVGL